MQPSSILKVPAVPTSVALSKLKRMLNVLTVLLIHSGRYGDLNLLFEQIGWYLVIRLTALLAFYHIINCF